MNSRRLFLRQLATLPLVGGAVQLIGQPTAAAVPINKHLAEAYLSWLRLEHTKLMHEIIDRPIDPRSLNAGWCSHAPEFALPNCPDMISTIAAAPAVSRAAVVMSAAGCDPRLIDTSPCRGVASLGRYRRNSEDLLEGPFDPFGPPAFADDPEGYEAYRMRVLNRTGDLLI